MIKEDNLNLIIKAIVKRRKKYPDEPFLQLYIDGEGGLQTLELKEIEEVLYKLQDEDNILDVFSLAHPKPPPSASSVIETILDTRWDPRIYFQILLRPSFDNWYSAFLLREKLDVQDLNPSNLKKIYSAVVDLESRLQINPGIKQRIHWSHEGSRNYISRMEALNFLKIKDVISHFEYDQTKIGQDICPIDVWLNFDKFLEYKEKVKSHYRDELAKKAPVKPKLSPIPADTKWEEITIQFLNGHDVKIKAKDLLVTVNFKEMGFEDKKKRLPNMQWGLLQDLASKRGQISWEDSDASYKIKKRKQLLSEALKEYFGIDEDPFYPYEETTYRIKINLIPE